MLLYSCGVPLQVYAPRRRQESRSCVRDSTTGRGRGDGGAAIGQPKSPAWKRSPSAEAISEQTKGWHGQGPLDARSKCFTDEHAFVVGDPGNASCDGEARRRDACVLRTFQLLLNLFVPGPSECGLRSQLRMASTLFPFPPKAPWTCLYASWKHGKPRFIPSIFNFYRWNKYTHLV